MYGNVKVIQIAGPGLTAGWVSGGSLQFERLLVATPIGHQEQRIGARCFGLKGASDVPFLSRAAIPEDRVAFAGPGIDKYDVNTASIVSWTKSNSFIA